MIRATATLQSLHGLRNQDGRLAASRQALLPCLGLALALALLTACGRPAPDRSDPPDPPHAPAAAAPKPAMPADLVAAPPAPLASSAAASATRDASTAASKPSAALPPAVIAFQQQRDACDHFRGEEPSDKQRAAFLKAQLAKTCTGSDKALAALRKRFGKHPQASAALKDYEDRIE